MHIGVTKKVENFKINPIFAKKVIKKKLMGVGVSSPPKRGIGLSKTEQQLMLLQ